MHQFWPLKSDSTSPATHLGLRVRLAHSLERHGRHDEERAHCDKAFELCPLEPLRVIWHYVRAEASLATGDSQSELEESQRGMAVNPGDAHPYVPGIAAAWRLGHVEHGPRVGDHPARSRPARDRPVKPAARTLAAQGGRMIIGFADPPVVH